MAFRANDKKSRESRFLILGSMCSLTVDKRLIFYLATASAVRTLARVQRLGTERNTRSVRMIVAQRQRRVGFTGSGSGSWSDGGKYGADAIAGAVRELIAANA